jgi:ribose transport system permease protein
MRVDLKAIRKTAFWARSEVRLAAMLFVVLVVFNIILNPVRFSPGNWPTVLGLAAPLLLATLATTLPFLAGRGSIDVSVGPLMALINVIIIKVLIGDAGISSAWIIIPAALLLGVASGVINGFLAAVLRIQPIVATLATYLIYSGLALSILPSPSGSVPAWFASLAGSLSFVPVGVIIIVWIIFKRLPLYELLMAVGSDDRAAYSAGVDVPAVRFFSYVFGGLIAGMAALALTALIGSGDPNIGPGYTLIAVAAAALGGVSLAGGIGGLATAFIGAADIFLLQNMLASFNVSTFVLQAAYGIVLVLAVSLNSEKLKQRFRTWMENR